MPLFECSECHSVDNTALTGFWWNVMHDNKPAQCSACDPEIGEWHGKFPRLTLEQYREKYPKAGPDAVQYTVEEVTKMHAELVKKDKTC